MIVRHCLPLFVVNGLHGRALRAKGEQEADLYVVSVLHPVVILSCLCLFPLPHHISEIPLSMMLNPNQTNNLFTHWAYTLSYEKQHLKYEVKPQIIFSFRY